MSTSSPVVLVTGAGRGIGRGVAVQLAAAGYSVGVNYRSNAEAAEATVEECRSYAAHKEQLFFALQGDVGEKESRNSLVEHTLSLFGRIDGLVNNAGVAPLERNDIVDATEESFERLMRINLQGPYFLTQKVVNYWLQAKPKALLSGGFKVVFVTSISADTVSLNRGEYCVSKAGAAMAVQLWARRLAGKNVQVYEVRPGIIETDMTKGVKQKYDPLIADGMVPQRRWGYPEDIGKAVRSLIEGDMAFSTGSVIHVDGGFHIKEL